MRHGEESTQACTTGGTPTAFSLPILNSRADHKQGCCSATDAEDARRVAQRLAIPFYALDLQAEFAQIIDYFVDEYSAGRTPNPCVMCNHWIKFGRLFDFADGVGAEFVATGHYARLTNDSATGEPQLRRGLDRSKDQSYALFGVQRPLLSRILLPVGDYSKVAIRALAAELGLRVAEKRDSQEICFVTSGHHDEFVRARRGDSLAGEIVTTEGRVVGTHPGIERFTIGQRKGLGIAMGEPYFVVRIEPATQRVIIGRHAELARPELTADRVHWLVDPPPRQRRCLAQIRYNAAAVPAELTALDNDRVRVVFDEPRPGVAPGQAVVLYDEDRVLGGGWIESY